jgi:hypothetical protein
MLLGLTMPLGLGWVVVVAAAELLIHKQRLAGVRLDYV